MPRRHLRIRPDGGSTAIHLPRLPELPQVVALGLVQVGRLRRSAPHAHPHHELHYVRSGRGSLSFGARSLPIRAGSTYLFRPGESHGGTADPADPPLVLYLGLVLPPALTAALERLPAPALLEPPAPLELRAALKAVADALVEGAVDAPALATALLRALAALSALARPSAGRRIAPRERELADAALRALELSDDPPALAALARQAGVGVDRLGRVLAAVTGRSWPALVAERRALAAQRLLQDPRLPVRSVARTVGLSGERALARLLRRVTGMSPADFQAAAGGSGP